MARAKSRLAMLAQPSSRKRPAAAIRTFAEERSGSPLAPDESWASYCWLGTTEKRRFPRSRGSVASSSRAARSMLACASVRGTPGASRPARLSQRTSGLSIRGTPVIASA
jgi:hypothetical protein